MSASDSLAHIILYSVQLLSVTGHWCRLYATVCRTKWMALWQHISLDGGWKYVQQNPSFLCTFY